MKKWLGFLICVFYSFPIFAQQKDTDIQREKNLFRLESSNFDILIIGGGSAGLGAAVDAASRGLKVALVERSDFASQTSSRSTKLLHGGVRYLEQLAMSLAMKLKFDSVLFNLIQDALREREIVLKIAPHLTRSLAIITPLYKTWEVPYYWIGLKVYDALAGKSNTLPGSRFISAKELAKNFPKLETKNLKGGVLYYDGQFNDTRMAIAMAKTAQELGVALANYVSVIDLKKDNSQIVGVQANDQLTNKRFEIKASVVINATGPFTDDIRKMDDPEIRPMISASSGTHIVLPSNFVAPDKGILIPKTDDGRILFILPWEQHTLIGTTDQKARIVEDPKAPNEDIDFILSQSEKYFNVKISRKDVLSHWTGLRPLVADPDSPNTAQLARDHVIQVSPSKLITIAGG